MKNLPALIIASFCVIMAGGCAYHGAVYSEYAQFALDVRSTAESSAPIKVDLGYDRGVLAYVPKLKGKTGEACSVISWQNIGSSPAPSSIGTKSVLNVDAGFISGTAANVASAPRDATVVVVVGPDAKAARLELKTIGGPGERIAAALPFAPATVIVIAPELQERKVALIQKIAALDPTKVNKILEAAGFPAVSSDKAKAALQDRILEARTEDAVKKLEDAFKTVQ